MGGRRGPAALLLLTAVVAASCSSSTGSKRAATAPSSVSSVPSSTSPATSAPGALGGSAPAASATPSGAPILYATFSGEKGAQPYQNVAGITSSGALVQNILQASNKAPALDELRGMALAAVGTLYVANAHKTESDVIAYGPPAAGAVTRPYLSTYAGMSSADPGLGHPYGLTADPAGNVLASSQDTCLVTRFLTSKQTNTGTTSAVAPWLQSTFPKDKFLRGTWVAQSTGASSSCTVPSPQVAHGLQEPRDIATDGRSLYAADNPAGVVHVYDLATGAWVKDLTPSGSGAAPVGLDLACSTLYVSSEGTNRVDAIDLATGVATPLPTLSLQAPSGVALVGGNLYANDRKAEMLYRYDLATKKVTTFVDYSRAGINDEPEELISTGPAPRCTPSG